MKPTPTIAPAQTIDEVIVQLQALIEDCIKRKDRMVYFAALYHKVTVRVKEGIVNTAVDTVGTEDIRFIRSDFNSINTITGSLIFEVLTEINRVSALLSLFGLHATNNSILIQFSITNARDGAWSFAKDLFGKKQTLPAYNACMNTRDVSIQKLGLALTKPKGLTRWIIHLFEWKNPAKVIKAFYGYQKQYITVNEAKPAPVAGQA